MRLPAGPALALVLAACAPTASLPGRPAPADGAIAVRAEPVAQSEAVTGAWTYAGGLHLTSSDTSRLHGLSDFVLDGATGRFAAVADDGDLVEGRLVLDATGRPSGVSETRVAPLTGLDGQSISGDKTNADAEGLAILASGDRLVSFERDHRIWLYPALGGPPRPAPSPPAAFPENSGMEALAADPPWGRDAYVAGGEDDGRLWRCRLTSPCQEWATLERPDGFSVTAATRLPGGGWAFLLRAFDPVRGARAELRVTDENLRLVDRLRLERPATVDNMEGIAAVGRPGGVVRFYLLSDDNYSPAQRTLLLAYDWRRPRGS